MLFSMLSTLCEPKWAVLCTLWAAMLDPIPTDPIMISNGLVRGAVAPDGSHVRYLSIPYASAPERFQAPQPEPKWEGVYDAFEDKKCKEIFSDKVVGDEDCLTLNVYTPNQGSDKLLPVMVFIHGGGFRDGSGSPFVYGPKFLVKHDIILVSVNYRLDVFGFLCLGIKEAPGNMGLKDQVESFKWVKRNIKAFGGDPDNITIFGESAGAASVMFHLLSPRSEGLFNRAIMQSASAIAPWSIQFDPLNRASLLAQQFGVKTEDPHEIYNLLKNVAAEDLLMHRVPRKKGETAVSEFVFVPCIEQEISGMEQFLPNSPYNLLSKGQYNKVPVIIGFNSNEGYWFVGKENDTTLEEIDFYEALPKDLEFPSEEEKLETAHKLKRLYMGVEKIGKRRSALQKLSKFEGDIFIKYPVMASVDVFLKTLDNPVYAYKFSYDGMLNIAKFVAGFRKYPGATHADELAYLFSISAPLHVETEFIDKFTTMWTNFAKFGDPTPNSTISPKWEPVQPEDPKLLVIDAECSIAPLRDDDEDIAYLNTTYSKYRRTS